MTRTDEILARETRLAEAAEDLAEARAAAAFEVAYDDMLGDR